MLLTPVSTLTQYDVPKFVLNTLSQSAIKHVSIIARRGPLEAAFTTKELRELMNLPDSSMVPIDPSILMPPSDLTLTRQQSRTLQLLSKGPKNAYGSTRKTWSLDFYRSPIGITVSPDDPSTAQLSLAHTMVDSRTQRAVPTGQTSTLPTSLVVTSLGFHGEPIASFYDPGLGHLRTLDARIITNEGHSLKNVYASGWAATGAKGVLTSTMINAYGAADTILGDMLPGREHEKPAELIEDIVLNPEPDLDAVPMEVEQGIMEGMIMQYADWKRVDGEEIRRGREAGRERERLNWEEMRIFLKRTSPRQWTNFCRMKLPESLQCAEASWLDTLTIKPSRPILYCFTILDVAHSSIARIFCDCDFDSNFSALLFWYLMDWGRTTPRSCRIIIQPLSSSVYVLSSPWILAVLFLPQDFHVGRILWMPYLLLFVTICMEARVTSRVTRGELRVWSEGILHKTETNKSFWHVNIPTFNHPLPSL